MPILFLVIGLILLVPAIRGPDQSAKMLALLKGDLWGDKSFFPWLISLYIIGALGYIEPLKPISRAFMVLVLLVLILTNSPKGGKGVFANLFSALNPSSTGVK